MKGILLAAALLLALSGFAQPQQRPPAEGWLFGVVLDSTYTPSGPVTVRIRTNSPPPGTVQAICARRDHLGWYGVVTISLGQRPFDDGEAQWTLTWGRGAGPVPGDTLWMILAPVGNLSTVDSVGWEW